MPITHDGLRFGLTMGALEFKPSLIGNRAPGGTDDTLYESLGIVALKETEDHNSKYILTPLSNVKGGSFFVEPSNVAGGTIKVKTYLENSCVLDIIDTGNVKYIGFILCGTGAELDGSQTLVFDAVGNWDGTPSFTLADSGYDDYSIKGSTPYRDPIIIQSGNKPSHAADMFMMIDVGLISVTQGGYLTVKGHSEGVANSDNFTYIELTSTT